MYQREYAMTGTNPAMVRQVMTQEHIDEAPEAETLETRFGTVTIYPKNPIVFPNGLLGLPDKFQFCLSPLPSDKLANFRLLQSLEDKALSFLTLPVAVDNPYIAREDIATACRDLDIPIEETAVLLIVSVQRAPTGIQVSANVRAPILVHGNRKLAAQYVFHNVKYQIRHPITL
jgi:flagellar assembly factor FliW